MRNGNAIALISRIRERANRLIIRELESCGIEGIVPSHGDIMGILFREESCTMTELAERIHRTKPTVTVLVDKLVEYGYVMKEKSSKDKRETFIKISEKGLSLQPCWNEISKKLNDMIYGDFSESEAELLEQMLTIVNNRLR